MIKVIILENQKTVRENFERIIELDCDIKVVGCANDEKEFFVLCEQMAPNVVLINLVMLDCQGFEAIKFIKEKQLTVKILIYSSFWNEDQIVRAFNNGADGCFDEDIIGERLIAGIKSAFIGLKVIDKELYGLISKTFDYNNNFETNYLNMDASQYGLTEKQLTILGLLAEGLKEEAVADEIGLSVNTIKYHKKKIFEKLDVVCTNEALVKATRMNLIISRTNEMVYAC